jgi:hypothetical protein
VVTSFLILDQQYVRVGAQVEKPAPDVPIFIRGRPLETQCRISDIEWWLEDRIL